MFSMDTGWPPPVLFVMVNMQRGIAPAPTSAIRALSFATSMFPLKGRGSEGTRPFGHRKVHSLGPGGFDVGPGGVKMGVVGHHMARLAHGGEENPLGRPPLVGGNHMFEPEDPLHRFLEPEKGRTPGIGLVPTHDACPLLGTHGRCPGIRQEVDENILGPELEYVVPSRLQVPSRSSRVVIRMGSTTLILKGSMMVFMVIPVSGPLGLKSPDRTLLCPVENSALFLRT